MQAFRLTRRKPRSSLPDVLTDCVSSITWSFEHGVPASVNTSTIDPLPTRKEEWLATSKAEERNKATVYIACRVFHRIEEVGKGVEAHDSSDDNWNPTFVIAGGALLFGVLISIILISLQIFFADDELDDDDDGGTGTYAPSGRASASGGGTTTTQRGPPVATATSAKRTAEKKTAGAGDKPHTTKESARSWVGTFGGSRPKNFVTAL
ncbi:hypothetical protein HPB51_003551 [Rhipicephalus microplus]|uniref:Uncharacterized protein n=1 Tax=Rhipicephalus microplus TaxID=6941 RepID=A0A9J6ERB2_RHIMP|nr:hypothetical protein HPB51_003551 [Rhipicephalus microplus]